MKHSELTITPQETNKLIGLPVGTEQRLLVDKINKANLQLILPTAEPVSDEPVPPIQTSIDVSRELSQVFADYKEPQYPYLVQQDERTIPDANAIVTEAGYLLAKKSLKDMTNRVGSATTLEGVRRGELMRALEDPELDFDKAMVEQIEAADASDRQLHP